jgi:hypothetical protein
MKHTKFKEVEIAKALIFLFLIVSFTALFGLNPTNKSNEGKE